jgi:hypothetical protein
MAAYHSQSKLMAKFRHDNSGTRDDDDDDDTKRASPA